MTKFADLTYTREELEKDAIHYLETQVYEPSYAQMVKDYLQEDMDAFKKSYDDAEYGFYSFYYDEYINGYIEDGDEVVPRFDFNRLTSELEDEFGSLGMDDEDIERHIMNAESEFKKNAYCSHMDPYFVGLDAVATIVVNGYTRNPIMSIYAIVREWCMAMHLKKLYPILIRRFGYQYQQIRENYTGEERIKKSLQFKDKYKLTIENVEVMRAVHSSLFAYTYLYLKAYLSQETAEMETFILDSASEPVELLLEGEKLDGIDFAAIRYALRQLKNGAVKGILRQDTSIDWNALYDFTLDVLKNAGGVGNMRATFGFDGIDAKAIQSFWNKSANMQKMLKILRRLAMDNSDPIFNQLIQMCEYRLGRPDKKKKKMERFIEETRKFMARQAYEITRPRTMAQELLAAFPSVFLVYFQWHHNFRNIYPKIPEKQVYAENQKRQNQQAEDTLKMRIYSDEMQRTNVRQQEEATNRQRQQEEANNRQTRQNEDDRLRLVIQSEQRQNEQRQNEQRQNEQRQNEQRQQSSANQGYDRGSR